MQLVALRDQDLRADDVDAGDHLGDRVLDLHARIDLDEEPLARIHVDEKLDRAGVVVAGCARKLDGGIRELAADLSVEIHGGRDFYNLLMTPLNRAVALVQMQDVSVLVAEDLNFDMLGAADIALEKHGLVAERRAGFLARFLQPGLEILRPVDDAHAAPAAAEGGFDDEREADAPRCFDRQPSRSVIGSRVPGIVGIFASSARRRAAVLSPSRSSSRSLGPTKVIPARSQARGSAGFSDRNP